MSETRDRITNAPFPPPFDIPESYNQLNTILSYYSLPIVNQADSFEEKIEKIIEIYNSKYLELNTEELKSILCDLERINEVRILEAQCDAWEVELANTKLCLSQKYGSKTVEELEAILEAHRSYNQLCLEFETNKDVLKKIENLDPSGVKHLAFMKEETFGAYARKKALNKLSTSKEEWAPVLYKIVKQSECKVEWLRKELNMDRINLLRILYNFSARGILEYDRLEDSVSIKKNS